MSTSNTVPEGAYVVTSTAGRPEEGPYAGRMIRLELYEGRASDGYKTEYTPRPARWVLLRLELSPPSPYRFKTLWCKRFTGKRFDAAAAEYASTAPLLKTAEA